MNKQMKQTQTKKRNIYIKIIPYLEIDLYCKAGLTIGKI